MKATMGLDALVESLSEKSPEEMQMGELVYTLSTLSSVAITLGTVGVNTATNDPDEMMAVTMLTIKTNQAIAALIQQLDFRFST